MSSEKRFGLLRNLLRAIGLSPEAVDDVVNFIVDLLTGEGKSGAQAPEFPYLLRDHFLSPAELSFYSVLRQVVNGRATLSTKVALGDLFYVKKAEDVSRWRIYTNKIDRKHVDFLLCNLETMNPLVGVELDDKSHQRPDRRDRDAFVDQVFEAAGLPILHIPAKRAYVIEEIALLVAPYLSPTVEPARETLPVVQAVTAPLNTVSTPFSPGVAATKVPRCPKCGSDMVLRTAKTGANAGNQFWGCSTYPACRGMLPYTE